VWPHEFVRRCARPYFKCDGTLDYREILNRSDVDAVIVATPDHWHAKIALEAMDKGKDVYLEKPMCHTVAEVKQLIDTVRETKRIVQVGSQTTSGDQWWKARKAIADGMLGDMIMSQGSYHRNSTEGEWNWKIDPERRPHQGRRLHRLEDVHRGGRQLQDPLRRRPLLPLPQVLGLLRRRRHRPLLPRHGADEHLLGRGAVTPSASSAPAASTSSRTSAKCPTPSTSSPNTRRASRSCSPPPWPTPSTSRA
jgi:hypothetical protein